ncbi:hypothetical protein BEP19_00865 [Ammoniphilus oxalaticus]|uniref:Shikimate kinase n=2 Tax=Ammoniphilus oxalaticus TaxID=66863 RepID=A0A419SNZ0_9BACL|nr:hypothetical protein BEP19_00865 [Ammoniphilus oxalaticus]
MGVGKTTIGEALAERLGWRPIDSDQWIERQQGVAISEIFATRGEAHFRQLETEAITEILEQQQQVVMTGGGAPLKQENREIMLAGGTVICLQATVQEIVERLRQDTSRPLLQGDLEERVMTLLEQRKDVYRFAPIQIDTTAKSVEQIVSEIEAALKHE